MFGAVFKGAKLAASPRGRKVISTAVVIARSDQGKKAIAQARRMATSPQSRAILNQAARSVAGAGKAATSAESRERIMEQVWDEHWFGSTKTLDVHVSWLRRKLGDEPPNVRYITTIRGVGLRFERGDRPAARGIDADPMS